MRAWIRFASTAALFVLGTLAFACGSDGDGRGDLSSGSGNGANNGAGTKGDSAFSPTATGNGGPTSGDGGSSGAQNCSDPSNAVEGCSCPTQGAEAACWTGPANLRRVDSCREGKATCVKEGEFLRWGPCTGQVLPGAPGVDANCQPTCKGDCVVGTARYCDEPNYCSWGKQDCLPNGKGGGSWGPCKEVPVPQGCEPPIVVPGFPVPNMYDDDCCKKLGFCCQVGGVDSPKSEGNCAGITITCQ